MRIRAPRSTALRIISIGAVLSVVIAAAAATPALAGTFGAAPLGQTEDPVPDDQPLPGYTMTGIIVPTDDGSIYFKIAGPDAAMAAAAEHIQALVKSAFPDAK